MGEQRTPAWKKSSFGACKDSYVPRDQVFRFSGQLAERNPRLCAALKECLPIPVFLPALAERQPRLHAFWLLLLALVKPFSKELAEQFFRSDFTQ